MSGLLAIVIVVAIVALALRGRRCAAFAFGRGGSDGWRRAALRRVGHVAVACEE